MMDIAKVCRVCAESGVLLELFGSKTQSVSYAEDVNKCLSLEASRGDGLPSQICVRCVGLINECLRLVNTLKNLGGEKQSHRRRGSLDSSKPKSCYFCESKENHLFPFTEASVIKTNDCFSIKVSDKEIICHRCQFCLDTVHDLKLKACASLKIFYSTTSLSTKEVEKTSNKKTESVGEIVNTLKTKYRFNMDKSTKLSKEVKVTVIDFAVVLGSDILSKGTINVNEFMQLIQPSSLTNGDISVSLKKKPRHSSLKQEVKSDVSDSSSFKPPGPKASRPGPKRHQKVTFDVKTTSVSKDSSDSEVSTSTPSQPTKKKRSRIVSDSEDEKPTKKTCVTSESPNSPSSTTNLKTDSPRQTRRSSITPDKEDRLKENTSVEIEEPNSEPVKPKTKKNSPRPKSKKVSKKESSFSTEEKPEEMDSPELNVNDIPKENSENSFVDESEKTSKRKRGRKSDANYTSFFSEDSPSPPAKIQRKRRDSEEKDFFSSKGKKKQWKSSVSDSSEIDDPNSSMNENSVIVEQPAFLKELDDLLRHTPKSTFRPFICSVCREGYVSTVKGMLHKLVAHDPHSNLLLKLTRCDDDGEMEKLREIISFRLGSIDNNTASVDLDIPKNMAVSNDDEAVPSDDDLFPQMQKTVAPKAVTKDLFEDLVSSTSYQNSTEPRAEELESTGSGHQDVDSHIEKSAPSSDKVLNEDGAMDESKDHQSVEDDKVDEKEEEKKQADGLVEEKHDEIQDELEQTAPEADENPGKTEDNVDPIDKIQEEKSTEVKENCEDVTSSEKKTEIADGEESGTASDVTCSKNSADGEEIGKAPEDVTSSDQSEIQQPDTSKGEECPSGVCESEGEEVEKESEGKEKETAESKDNTKESSLSECDKEKSSVECDVENGSKVTEDSDSAKNHEEKISSEIQEDSVSSEKTNGNNPEHEDCDEQNNAPVAEDESNEKHVDGTESHKDILEHDEHKSLSETEKAAEEAHCEGIMVEAN